MRVIRALAAVDDGLRNRLATGATGLLRLVVVLDRVMPAVRDRQAAMKAA
jgi:hypothetical protein